MLIWCLIEDTARWLRECELVILVVLVALVVLVVLVILDIMFQERRVICEQMVFRVFVLLEQDVLGRKDRVRRRQIEDGALITARS